jgi:DedD protein
MDKALKARLIGAAVLVAVAVLLIPELLSGRKSGNAGDEVAAVPPGTRTFTIELAGSGQAPPALVKPASGSDSGAAPAQETPPASGPASAIPDAARDSAPASPTDGKPANQPPARDAGAPAPVPQPAAPDVKANPPAPAARTTAAASTVQGGWAVQVGAFSTAEKAGKLAAELKSAGYRAYVSPISRSGKTLQRVRVGPEADRSRAEGIAAKLKARGLPATVVASD